MALLVTPPRSSIANAGTRAEAELRHFPLGVTGIRTDGRAVPGDGGQALWKRASAQPGHPAWFSSADGAIWELAERVLRPEIFGRTGATAELDTAAWQALAAFASTLSAQAGEAMVEAYGAYALSGPVTFRGGRRYSFQLTNARFRQTLPFSPTLHFHTCDEVSILGGVFTGLGGRSREFDGASSSHNGVAAVYFEHVNTIRVRDTQTADFAGGAFFVLGGRIRDFEGVTCKGIGAPYINHLLPSPNQANGGDAALHFVPASPFPGWIYEDRIVGCRLYDHAFGVRTVATRSLILSNNEIGPCPGQHGVYGTDLDGVVATGNTFRDCRQAGFKNQLENYAGLRAGEVWAPRTAYAVGQEVRSNDILLECIEAHTSSERFEKSKWEVSGRFRRGGGVFSSNRVERCGTGFHQLATSALAGLASWSAGWVLEDNDFIDCAESAIRGERMLSARIIRNRIERTGSSSVFLTNFGGEISGNTIRSSQTSALLVGLSEDAQIHDNRISDSGLNGADQAQRASIVFFPPDAASAIPGLTPHPVASVSDNEFAQSRRKADAPYLLFGYDSRLRLHIVGNRTDQTSPRAVRWDGELLVNEGNDLGEVVSQ